MKRPVRVANWAVPGSEIVTGWTLQPAEAYLEEIAKKDNYLSPGATIFETKEQAEAAVGQLPALEGRSAFPVWLPGTWNACTTTARSTAYTAFHLWHRRQGYKKSAKCGLCMRFPVNTVLPVPVTLVETLILNPETMLPTGWPVQ